MQILYSWPLPHKLFHGFLPPILPSACPYCLLTVPSLQRKYIKKTGKSVLMYAAVTAAFWTLQGHGETFYPTAGLVTISSSCQTAVTAVCNHSTPGPLHLVMLCPVPGMDHAVGWARCSVMACAFMEMVGMMTVLCCLTFTDCGYFFPTAGTWLPTSTAASQKTWWNNICPATRGYEEGSQRKVSAMQTAWWSFTVLTVSYSAKHRKN